MMRDLQPGDEVYVRAEFRQWIDGTDSAQVYIRKPDGLAFFATPVPRGRIVVIESEPKSDFQNTGLIAPAFTAPAVIRR